MAQLMFYSDLIRHFRLLRTAREEIGELWSSKHALDGEHLAKGSKHHLTNWIHGIQWCGAVTN